MIYESQIFSEGSTLKWGFVFKRHADDEDPIYVLMIGEASTLCLKAIGDSFAAHQWAAKAICDSSIAQEKVEVPPEPTEVEMRTAQAVLNACQRAVDKNRPLTNLNLDSIVLNARKQ